MSISPERIEAANRLISVIRAVELWEERLRDLFGDTDQDFPWDPLADLVLDLLGVPTESQLEEENGFDPPKHDPHTGEFIRDVYHQLLLSFVKGDVEEWDGETYEGKALLKLIRKDAERLQEEGFSDPLTK